MNARPELLELEGVRKSYGDGVTTEVLHGVDLCIGEGELVALVGPSGSGKSTLLNLIGLLDRPTQGRIAIDGRAVENLDDQALTALRGEKLGFIFQSHHLLPGLSVIENVMLPSAAARGGFQAGMKPPARALLDAMGLGRLGRGLAAPAFGRHAAARRGRPSPDERTAARACRRADRKPRYGNL